MTTMFGAGKFLVRERDGPLEEETSQNRQCLQARAETQDEQGAEPSKSVPLTVNK